MQTLNNFKCHTNCKQQQCQHHHAKLGFVDRTKECECSELELTGSSLLLENVIDLSHTLARIMIVCGIHECKANTAIDIITNAFLHYDLVSYCLDAKPTKRLRKEDIFHELGRKCLMNRIEAHLCYTIIKRGFKAFYYQPQEEEYEGNAAQSYSQECVYVHAAKKTAEAYAKFDGLSCDEQGGIEAKIKMAYKKFYNRMQSRKRKPQHDDCNCSFCNENGRHLVYGTPAPSCPKPKQVKKHSCSHCCNKNESPKFIHPQTVTPNCPVCHCSCAKYQFNINWIRSIWDRSDMNQYYVETIEKPIKEPLTECNPQISHHNEVESEGKEEENEVAEIVEGILVDLEYNAEQHIAVDSSN